MTGSCFSTKITEVSFWNVMERPFTCGRDDRNLGFRNILCIVGPKVVYTISTEYYYCFTGRHAACTLIPVLFFLLSTMAPNMLVVNIMAFIVLTLIKIFIDYINYKVS